VASLTRVTTSSPSSILWLPEAFLQTDVHPKTSPVTTIEESISLHRRSTRTGLEAAFHTRTYFIDTVTVYLDVVAGPGQLVEEHPMVCASQ
jgi:hypothetical protein